MLREVGLSRPDGEMLVAEAEVEIQPGERVLIRGQSGSGKSTIMRAVAGVWPWGRGAVQLPKRRTSPSCRRSPISRSARCARSCSIRKSPEDIDDDVLKEPLHKVGLDHLRGRLDEEERWDHILSGGEQQRVAFARVLIQRPDWIFMDEATSALDEAGQDNIMTLLIEELPDTAVVSIGHRPGLEAFHTRELVLEPGEDGAKLRARVGERGLRDIYRRMAAASRAEPAGPGFWSELPQDARRPLREAAATPCRV